MERLAIDAPNPYDPAEVAIHVARYASALPFAPGRRVLDSLCGEGYGSWLLAQRGALHVTGTDISVEAIRTAQARFRSPTVSFVECSASKLTETFPHAAFNLVVSLETIEHVVDPDEYLHALRRLATPDAVVIISCPNDHWYYPIGPGNPHHLRKYTLSEFQEITQRVFGTEVTWHLGTAMFGFVTEPLGEPAAQVPDAWPDRIGVPDSLTRVPTGPRHGPTEMNCSYFVGVWNAPETVANSGAWYSVGMDHGRRVYEDVAILQVMKQQVSRLESDLLKLTIQNRLLFKEHSLLISKPDYSSPFAYWFGTLRPRLVSQVKRSPLLFSLLRRLRNLF